MFELIKNLDFFELTLNPLYHDINNFDIVVLIMDLYEAKTIKIKKYRINEQSRFINNILA